jgi:hypothetical protein
MRFMDSRQQFVQAGREEGAVGIEFAAMRAKRSQCGYSGASCALWRVRGRRS